MDKPLDPSLMPHISTQLNQSIFKYNAQNFLLNKDTVTAQIESETEMLNNPRLDLGEERITFFTADLPQSTHEFPALLDQTSLCHFNIRQCRHKPLKRDIIEQAFVHDLEIFRVTCKNYARTLKWMVAKGMLPEQR